MKKKIYPSILYLLAFLLWDTSLFWNWLFLEKQIGKKNQQFFCRNKVLWEEYKKQIRFVGHQKNFSFPRTLEIFFYKKKFFLIHFLLPWKLFFFCFQFFWIFLKYRLLKSILHRQDSNFPLWNKICWSHFLNLK